MTTLPLLLLVLLLPFLGAFFILFIRSNDRIIAMNSRHVGLLISGCTFILSVFLGFDFNFQVKGFQYQSEYAWLPNLGVSWHIGLDALSLVFIILISFLMFMSFLASKKLITSQVREYTILCLVLESFLLITVCARDLFLYFIFYEGAIIPLFMLIALFGIEKRALSSFKFCISVILGGVLSFCGILFLYTQIGSADMSALNSIKLPSFTQSCLLFVFVASFGIKAGLVPFHSWFVDAQTESPAPISILLGCIFTPVALYGFLRIGIPISHLVFSFWTPYLIGWSVFSCLYGAMIASVQTDLKKLGAYTNISHLSLCAVALFCSSVTGSLFLVITHSLSYASYIFAIGVLISRLGSRDTKPYSGLSKPMPLLSIAFLGSIFVFASFPASPSFFWDFLILKDLFVQNKIVFFLICLSILILAIALSVSFSKTMLGEPSLNGKNEVLFVDLSVFEKTWFAVLGGVLVYILVFPQSILNFVSKSAGLIFTGEG